MTHIFYLMAIWLIIKETTWIASPKEKVEGVKKFDELSKLNKGKKWDEYSMEYKTELKNRIISLPLILWLFIGLFTFQWDAFLIVILFNFLVIAPLSRLTKYSFAYMAIHWVNSIIGFAFGIFVIINHYHLHISLWQVITNKL